mgnify:FL=1|jgi:hypothetical protein|tara:strand:+ start:3505 stop:3813 length:309 start_codon:yes stop_codon:yes gene_type:complete
MGRIAGVPNKMTTEVKEKLQVVLDDVVSSLNIDEMTTDQKIKMLQLGLQYLLPKLKHTSGDRDKTDYPLFMTPGDPITIDIHSRNEDTGEFEVERSELKRRV